jgi:hypothetical protein
MFFDWFGKNWTPRLSEPTPLWRYGPEIRTKEQPPRKISANDDTMTRAENIVWALGFEGDVAHLEKKVYEALNEYEKLDKNVKDEV